MPSLDPRAASNSLYWKFNSSLLADPNFLPAFRAMWLPLAAARPHPCLLSRTQPDRIWIWTFPLRMYKYLSQCPSLPLRILPWRPPPLFLACP
jgi:hypothetical protein